MNVINKKFFHIHRGNKFSKCWTVGNTLTFEQPYKNTFISYYDDFCMQIAVEGASYPVMEAIEIIKRQELYSDADYAKQLLEQMSILAKEFALYMREDIFEEVRKAHFPELPSRKSCIWVCEEAALNYWDDILEGEAQIFEVAVTGKIHRADQRHLSAKLLPGSVIWQNAVNYWNGADGSNSVEEEIIAEGEVEILRRIR